VKAIFERRKIKNSGEGRSVKKDEDSPGKVKIGEKGRQAAPGGGGTLGEDKSAENVLRAKGGSGKIRQRDPREKKKPKWKKGNFV